MQEWITDRYNLDKLKELWVVLEVLEDFAKHRISLAVKTV